jgi:tagaturonate reductase
VTAVSAASLPPLNAALARAGDATRGGAGGPSQPLPERVIQFGEGNFLRGFVDWMLQRMNARGLFGGRAVLVQPLPTGAARQINAQDGLYTVVLRGLSHGVPIDSRELVSAVSRCIDPYTDFDAFLACAANPDLRFVVSNTTEAGICVDLADAPDARPARSFPGKLTQLLFARYQRMGGDPARGLVMLPCELIERNGDALARAVHETARRWALPTGFLRWLDDACLFTTTLVDRIVTGYPAAEAAALGAALGYDDRLLVAGEIFHTWVIETRRETPRPLAHELPLAEAGLRVIWTSDITPFRERKVRILNGAHTMTALAAFLAGLDTVRACVDDPLLGPFLRRGIEDDILPTLGQPRDELRAFAAGVIERFANPFIEHQLLSIALNSVSKYRARILPTVRDHVRLGLGLPPRLTFALAALLAFYRGRELRDGVLIGRRAGAEYRICDEPAALEALRAAWTAAGDAVSPSPSPGPSPAACLTLARTVLARADLWGDDLIAALPGLDAAVADHLHAITGAGARAAIERLARL